MATPKAIRHLVVGPVACAEFDHVGDDAAKVPWFLDAYRQAWGWADASGWRPV